MGHKSPKKKEKKKKKPSELAWQEMTTSKLTGTIKGKSKAKGP